MSRRSYSRHIPDFRLVTHIAESGRSTVHAMTPWTKAGLLVLSVLFVVILTDLYLLMVLFALSVAFYAAGRIPLTLLVGWYTLPVLFVATLTIMFVFTEPGTALVSFSILDSRIALTDNGVLLFVELLLRALTVVTVSLAVFMTTKYSYIASMASRVLPRPLDNIFLLSYRFTFETSDEMSDVLDAMHARNGNLLKGVSRQTRLFAGIFGLAFVHAFERAERIAKAMEARGFQGDFPATEPLPRPTYRGYALLALGAGALALVTYSRYFENILGWW